jgi:hypothetical protein
MASDSRKKSDQPAESTPAIEMQKLAEPAEAAESLPSSETTDESKGRSKLRTIAILIALFVRCRPQSC